MLFPLSGHSRDFHLRPSVQERERQLNRFYAEILRHTVAVIEHARTEIARHVNGYVSTGYWKMSLPAIGRLVKCFMNTRLKADMVTAL